jgi:hypothetical protein
LHPQNAQMAELVDALVSNTSGFTSISVRSRAWVPLAPLNQLILRGFLFSQVAKGWPRVTCCAIVAFLFYTNEKRSLLLWAASLIFNFIFFCIRVKPSKSSSDKVKNTVINLLVHHGALPNTAWCTD